jgi:hypothetical protein
MALDAELVLYRNCEWTEKRESRLKQRNFDLILFFESACVKENRKLPLCKKKSDDGSSPGTVRHLGEKTLDAGTQISQARFSS